MRAGRAGEGRSVATARGETSNIRCRKWDRNLASVHRDVRRDMKESAEY